MDRYVISSITEMPGAPCQWELVAQDGTILLLTYATGELTLSRWVSAPDSPGRDGSWEQVANRRHDELSILERMRDCQISLDDAIAMMRELVAVTPYVASYELPTARAYDLMRSG